MGYVILLFGNGCSLNKDIYDRNRYSFTVDLTNMTDDQIHVELIPPKLINDSIEFVFPVSELAYYNDDLHHGKLISNLKVYDAQHHLLKTNKKADNRWVIYCLLYTSSGLVAINAKGIPSSAGMLSPLIQKLAQYGAKYQRIELGMQKHCQND